MLHDRKMLLLFKFERPVSHSRNFLIVRMTPVAKVVEDRPF